MIVANLKMNLPDENLKNYLKKINSLKKNVVICVPCTHLHQASKYESKYIKIASQNIHNETKGAFTGAISSTLLKDININYCLIGHSERRELFFETDEMINLKVKNALNNNFKIILCIGEKIKKTDIKIQLLSALNGIDLSDLNDIVIAYEPLYSIGTGKIASIKTITNRIEYIFNLLKLKYQTIKRDDIKILYGGSVDDSNIESIKSTGIDGVIIGCASLNTEKMISIVRKFYV